ncbi:hypothetical protein KFL_002720080 [Klebsormidium nitens]|uniref:G-patch domain-containing protein n=1 Tax=Klebsormidium nitens TaxID=105231 RepID=A0A1Y1I5A3_KLENI|nr:hypothetical protein KFL_002720080 [Klebsormidium nitens]|eukprot:GAQ86134.1 hypothetical protein KFL_002720080 [Klebsormidium nitens]
MADQDPADEPDYMADLSIFGIAESAPSLTNSKTSGAKKLPQQSAKPRLTFVQKQQQRKERVFEKEEKLRQEGMAQAIPQGNIGFKLLEKMGYKPGGSLGQPEQGGITEPLELKVKRAKTGLGRDEIIQQEQQEKAARRARAAEHRQRQQQELALDFRDRAKGRWDFRKVRRDLGRAETALATIEGEDGPWRDVVSLEGVNKDGNGSVLEGDSVLEDEVGLDVRIARKRKLRPGERSLDEEEEAKNAVEEVSDEDRVRILERMLRRLRDKHWYCIYCGVKYDSQEDIDTECPGEDEDLH